MKKKVIAKKLTGSSGLSFIPANKMLRLLTVLFLVSIISCMEKEISDQEKIADDYYVAAYIWPSCHHDDRFGDKLWPEGTGEWEIIKKGTPRFEGHYQPKVPLWGYEMDNNPQVMEKWINAATDHGVNVFIFDWYWYEGGPFLESCLNDGFLKADNNEKMKFYIMWANHDLRWHFWNPHLYEEGEVPPIPGSVDFEEFKVIVDRIINQYFKKPNYFKIEGKPVFHVFSPQTLVNGLGGLEQTKDAIEYFREETKKAGFPGLHFQLRATGRQELNLVHGTLNEGMNTNEIVDYLGVNSVTVYGWGRDEDYIRLGVKAMDKRSEIASRLDIPYFPNVTINYDDTPRFPDAGKERVILYNNTPESFAAFLQKAKEYCDDHPDELNLITVFSWNEWIEGGYLLPDMKNGFGYLESVKKVMSGKYNPYSDD